MGDSLEAVRQLTKLAKLLAPIVESLPLLERFAASENAAPEAEARVARAKEDEAKLRGQVAEHKQAIVATSADAQRQLASAQREHDSKVAAAQAQLASIENEVSARLASADSKSTAIIAAAQQRADGLVDDANAKIAQTHHEAQAAIVSAQQELTALQGKIASGKAMLADVETRIAAFRAS